MIIAIKADCNCGNYMGVHCGERATDQSGALKGDCNKDVIYQCPASNVPAQSKGYCSYCAKGEKMGTDYCAVGREGMKIYKNIELAKSIFQSLTFLQQMLWWDAHV
jgi:hypothetical protein